MNKNLSKDYILEQINLTCENFAKQKEEYNDSSYNYEKKIFYSNDDWENEKEDYLDSFSGFETKLFNLKIKLNEYEPDFKNLSTKRLLSLFKKYRNNQFHIPIKIVNNIHLNFWKNYYTEMCNNIKFELNNREHIVKEKQ